MSVAEYLGPLIDIVEVSYGSGSYNEIVFHSLGAGGDIPNLDIHRWPDPSWFDYEGLPEVIERAQAGSDKCIMVGNGNIFETSWYNGPGHLLLRGVLPTNPRGRAGKRGPFRQARRLPISPQCSVGRGISTHSEVLGRFSVLFECFSWVFRPRDVLLHCRTIVAILVWRSSISS